MGFRRNQARRATRAAEEAYSDDMGKAHGSGLLIGNLFRKIGTGQIPEEEIGREAKAVEEHLRRDYPEAWDGGVKDVFKRFFG